MNMMVFEKIKKKAHLWYELRSIKVIIMMLLKYITYEHDGLRKDKEKSILDHSYIFWYFLL